MIFNELVLASILDILFSEKLEKFRDELKKPNHLAYEENLIELRLF